MGAPALRSGDAAGRRYAAAVAALTVAYIAAGAFTAAGYDTGRDVAHAYALAEGLARPEHGPRIAGSATLLGPWYYYLLALPILLSGTWLAASLWVALLGSLQLPLGYALGRQLGGPRLGLMIAAALVLPGWATFEHVGWSHTNLVRTAVLAWAVTGLLCWRRRAPPWFVAVAATASLAAYAHPTTVWTFAVLPVLAVRLRWDSPVAATKSGLALVAAAALVSLAFADALAGALASTEVTRTAQATVRLENLQRVPQLAEALAAGGSRVIWALAWQAPAWVGSVGHSLTAALAAAGAIGAALGLSRRAGRPLAAGALAWFAAVLVAVALSRPFTPFYMVYTVVPPFAVLLAVGWDALARDLGGARLAAAVCALAVALWAVALVGLAGTLMLGEGRVAQASLADVAAPTAGPEEDADVWLPAWSVDALGRALCTRPVEPHAALRYVLDVHYFLPLRMHCGESPAPASGQPPPYLALPAGMWPRVGVLPESFVGSLGLAPVHRVVAHGSAARPELLAYPPHRSASGPEHRVGRAFSAPAGALVVVSNPLQAWTPWRVSARCAGEAAIEVARDRVVRVYRCPLAAAEPQWAVDVVSPAPERIELLVLRDRPPGESGH